MTASGICEGWKTASGVFEGRGEWVMMDGSLSRQHQRGRGLPWSDAWFGKKRLLLLDDTTCGM